MLKKLVVTTTEKIFYFSGKPAVITGRYHCGSLYQHEKNMLENGTKTVLNDRVTVYTAPTTGCSKYENTAHCIRIAENLDAIANGDCYICPECREIIENYTETDNSFVCDCGCTADYEPETASMGDYFTEYYNIEYRIGSDMETLNSVEIMIAYGGPNIYVDTADAKIKLYWWGEYAEASLDRSTATEIDNYFDELWCCRC